MIITKSLNSINFLFLGFFTMFLLSCNEDKSISEINNEDLSKKINSHKSFYKTNEIDYKGQLPYLNSESSDIIKSDLYTEIESKISNDKYSWEYFDNLYNNEMTLAEKQKLAYIVLSQKDLIGLLKNNTKNQVFHDKVKKHINILVESEYIGYCLLYNALESVKTKDIDFVKKSAKLIENYSYNDDFHSDIIANVEMAKDPHVSKYFHKIKENYSYLDKIKDLK